MSNEPKVVYVFVSSITGEFASKKFAEENPDTTFRRKQVIQRKVYEVDDVEMDDAPIKEPEP